MPRRSSCRCPVSGTHGSKPVAGTTPLSPDTASTFPDDLDVNPVALVGGATRSRALPACRHCGTAVPEGRVPGREGQDGPFCCSGCEAAFALIRGLGLDGYYRRRSLDPDQRPLIPDADAAPVDYASYVRRESDGISSLHLMIEGLHCAACVWLIESVLGRQTGVISARVNMTTRRLALRWNDHRNDAETLVAAVARLGYRLVPYDPTLIGRDGERRETQLLRALAVAGFAAGNVMLSVAVWAGHAQGMGEATRGLLHWISALIALPAVAYAGVPFFRSALGALRGGHVNMDVPISLAVILAAGMSLHEVAVGAEHAYFDSAVTLLFFLLVGRYLDHRARGRARSAAEHLLALGASAVTVIDDDGSRRLLTPAQVRPGLRALAAAGDRIAVDGRVVDGDSDVDTSLIDGETVPTAVAPGAHVFAGTINVSGPLVIEITAVGENTLLAEIARQVEAAEQGRSRYVAVADRLARLYAPVVHGAAAVTFLGWWLYAGVPWQSALLTAIAVLIITCPCALALAVPAVQVIATGRLLRKGILVTSATALERLATADTIVFDKTGTLTGGRPRLDRSASAFDRDDLALAASLAHSSRHVLARAVVRAAEATGIAASPATGVREVSGRGLEWDGDAGTVRLGSRAFVGVADDRSATGTELWLTRPGAPPIRFGFVDPPRCDAAAVVSALAAKGSSLAILSGDREAAASAVAVAVGIADWRASCLPADKCRRLGELAAAGRRVAMVGDGLNDAPALAAAHVSLSPSTAVDLARTAADVIFQGARLAPVLECLEVARRAYRLVRQNFALALLYNVVTVPLAVAGLVTPLVAAIAMSASSLAVIANALRLNRTNF
ncbi:MAG: cadmium-translocating P-type ATPase [Rhodospirillales bacterium]|nr:cadmium-translocating P-type ATPase [Rhodospirillales bacterium]